MTMVHLRKLAYLRSNYTTNHKEEMYTEQTNIVPAVNLVEFHPFFNNCLRPEYHKVCSKPIFFCLYIVLWEDLLKNE
ncbi:unnamed protein product [Macrosiphum euphorbiae]|uniref:Uncharacterized protein n=1 Tax=Macrosiphum euphorbiae TaxID=13131 RepID=A0AAV0X8V9_9HEMI|nr:unnamed protein product [Macrosiphum euphorbiae]